MPPIPGEKHSDVSEIGALIAHIILFWGGDIVKTFKNAKKGNFNDPHHVHMHKHYKEAPWWWYMVVLGVSFILGLIVVIKENITLPGLHCRSDHGHHHLPLQHDPLLSLR
jgi:hypothetical protein